MIVVISEIAKRNSFVGALLGFDFWTPSNVYEFDPYYGENMANVTHYPYDRPLVSQLLNHPIYRKQYTAHIRTIVNESLNSIAIKDQVDELQTIAYLGALNDGNKVHSMNDYSNNVDNAIFTWYGFGGIVSTVNERKIFLHLTKNYQPTAGCIALKKKDFLILAKLQDLHFHRY